MPGVYRASVQSKAVERRVFAVQLLCHDDVLAAQVIVSAVLKIISRPTRPGKVWCSWVLRPGVHGFLPSRVGTACGGERKQCSDTLSIVDPRVTSRRSLATPLPRQPSLPCLEKSPAFPALRSCLCCLEVASARAFGLSHGGQTDRAAQSRAAQSSSLALGGNTWPASMVWLARDNRWLRRLGMSGFATRAVCRYGLDQMNDRDSSTQARYLAVAGV